MEDNHKLTLYVTYYLSRFNDIALTNLGYASWNDAYDDISEKLNVKRLSVRNWRDEFDPLFGYRAGWYQRPMSPSRIKVVQALESLDEYQIRNIVQDILSGKIKEEPDEEKQLLSIASDEIENKSTPRFILRTPTGKAAEEFFIKYYSQNKKPFSGTLTDCRDFGVGYDFKIEVQDKIYYIEVKGLSDFAGGVLFTSKEWAVAENERENYFLCVVSNLSEQAEINFINNPFVKLAPKKNIYTTIQISWSVTEKQLAELND